MVYVRYGRGGGGLGCLLLGILGLIAAYYILKWFFIALYVAIAPVLFVVALLLNWRAVVDTVRDLLSTLGRNPLYFLLAVLGYPLVAIYMFLRALGYKRMEQFGQTMREQHQTPEDEFIEFEELESRPKNTTTVVEDIEVEPLPEPEKPAPEPEEPPKTNGSYDQFFR
jgi:hypothetical protein